MSIQTEAVVLAAGQGTRMDSEMPKVCHRCFGEPMIVHIARSLGQASVDSLTAVVGEGREEVESVLPAGVTTVIQEDQLGTGHALRQAIEGRDLHDDTPVLVTCGDIPGVRPETYRTLLDTFESSAAGLVLLSTSLDDPEGYGRVKLSDDDTVESIVEHLDASPDEKQIGRINTGIMCGSAAVFSEYLPRLENDNEAGEYYLTDVVELMNEDGRSVDYVEVEDEWEVTGINTRRQLIEFEEEGYRRRVRDLLEDGVTVHDPNRAKIGPWVEVGRDVEFEGDVYVYGSSRIESGVRLLGSTRVVDSVIGSGTTVDASTLKSTDVGQDVSIGPHAHLRPGATIGDQAKVGNFVEVKNSSIGARTNVSHLSYIGDADIGENVNVGAGTITCNYDGDEKHRTVVENDVFIGSNVEIVAPATIGKGAILGAGSTITKDVPPGDLGIGRAHQDNIEDWNDGGE